jgi:hypothetical protein
MPIEVALFLLRQAGALVGGILEKTRGNIEQAGADQLTKFVFKVAKGPSEREQADSTTQAELEAEITAEQATTAEVLEENEAGAEELQSRFGFALTSALPPDRIGTDASLVRAYEAVLWRLSVLASWERRAIAVSGALQGRDWITICAPRVPGAVIAPSSIWQAADADSVLRRPLKRAPVKFFVRPNAGNAKPDEELTAVDTKLRRDGARRFEPTQPAEPADVDAWHRVDGLHAVWVPLQPDTHTADALENANAHMYEKRVTFGKRNVEIHPPRHEEYPEEWQRALLDISPTGLASLIDGIDKFASHSAAAKSAVDVLLPPGGP